MNEGVPTVKAGTYRNPETGSPRRDRLTGRWLLLSAGTAEGGKGRRPCMDKENQPPASGPFQDDRRRGIGLPYGSGGFRVRFFERFTAFDLDQVFPEDAPQFHGGGRVILHAVPGRNDFFTGAPVQVG